MLDTVETETDAPAAAAPRKPRETTAIDGSILTITLPDGTVETYDAHKVHNDSAHTLKMVGLRHAMSTSIDRAKTYAALQAGTFGVRAPAAAKALDVKRQAIALGLVDKTRKSDKPMSLGGAEAIARSLDRKHVEDALLDPLANKHLLRLTGKTGLDALLSTTAGE